VVGSSDKGNVWVGIRKITTAEAGVVGGEERNKIRITSVVVTTKMIRGTHNDIELDSL